MNELPNRPISIRKITIFYFKANRKRTLSLLIINSILFFILISIIILSFSQYQNSFYNNVITKNDWFNNDEVSISGYKIFENTEQVKTDLLINAIDESTELLNDLNDNIVNETVGVTKIGLYNFLSYDNYEQINLYNYDTTTNDILMANLEIGNLPEKSTEILYYNFDNDSSYEIGDIINITGYKKLGEYPIIFECQIVGIVNNLSNCFFENQLSTDILFNVRNTFFTTNMDYFVNIAREVKNEGASIYILIDIDYAISSKHFITNSFTKALYDLSQNDISFTYFHDSVKNHFCTDLRSAIVSFKLSWYKSIYNQFLICVPLIFLASLVVLELFRFGNNVKRVQYRLFKTTGLENRDIAKILFLENIILYGISLGIGLFFSLIFDYVILSILLDASSFSFLSSIWNSVAILLILSSFLVFFITNYVMDLIQVKKTKEIIHEEYKNKQRSFLSKIFSLPELNFLIPGLIFATFGLLVSFLSFNESFDDIYNYLFFIPSSIMALVGIVFLFLALILFLKRILIFFWYRTGIYIWKKKKNILSITMKHLSISVKQYSRTILASFLLGLCITPGIIAKKSIKQHNLLEANLSIGCADLLIDDLDLATNIRQNISAIDGILSTTLFSKIDLEIDSINFIDESLDTISFYVIYNTSEFINTIDLTYLMDDGLTSNDVLALDSELTYIMNRKYAKANGYNQDNIFTTIGITPSVYQYKELVYVNDFSYFPLIERKKFEATIINDIFNKPTYIELVVTNRTKDLILEHNEKERTEKNYLLIKINENANISAIEETILANYNIETKSLDEALSNIESDLNYLGLNLSLVVTILAFLLLLVFIVFNTINVMNSRNRILDILIKSGIDRRSLRYSLAIEILLVIIIPTIISIGLTIPYLNNLSGYMFNIVTNYTKFNIAVLWWVSIVILIAIVFNSILINSIVSDIYLRNYRLKRQD